MWIFSSAFILLDPVTLAPPITSDPLQSLHPMAVPGRAEYGTLETALRWAALVADQPTNFDGKDCASAQLGQCLVGIVPPLHRC